MTTRYISIAPNTPEAWRTTLRVAAEGARNGGDIEQAELWERQAAELPDEVFERWTREAQEKVDRKNRLAELYEVDGAVGLA